VTAELVAIIGRLVASLPDGALDRLVSVLEEGASRSAVLQAVPSDAYRDQAQRLVNLMDETGADGFAVALAIAAAREREQMARGERISIVWTGPETSAVAMRRMDEALLELIAMTRKRLIIVAFAVYKVPAVADALVACSERGCDIAVMLESEAESGGRVTYEMSQALGIQLAQHATLYTWPLELRPDVGAGRRASLHAKCAVGDEERLLVSSANLTEYAFTKNIELGLLIEGGAVPCRVQAHLEALITSGVLRPVGN
jgi:phosphatidylserine/phosphatidylglycerophosphate/cardiolipin synthase-like enzyme